MTLPTLMVVLVVMLSVFIGGAAVALQRCRTDHLDFHIIVGQQFDGAVFYLLHKHPQSRNPVRPRAKCSYRS